MGTYPDSPRSAFLDWAQSHAATFLANDTQIGLTEAEAMSFETTANTAIAAVASQFAAKEAAKAATVNSTQLVNALRAKASLTVAKIRNFAISTNNLNVYVLAQIPPPATPTAVPPPARPTDLTVSLNNTSGALTLKWKASNPVGATGITYVVNRRLSSATAFTPVGIVGKKSFVDETFAAGPDSVQYMIQAQRSGVFGEESDIFIVNFGQSPGGAEANEAGVFTLVGSGQAKKAA